MKRISLIIVVLILAGLTMSTLLGAIRSAKAGSTITVTNTNDSGAGSLRQAISGASSGDTISFDAGLNGQTITLTSGRIAIETSVTIAGLGSTNLTISGNYSQGIFVVFSGPTVISGLRLSGGNFAFAGGAIENQAALSVIDCDISGNSTSASGGGVSNSAGAHLTLTDCRITNNSAASAGGGIANFNGTVTVIRSTISGNGSNDSGGGGILNDGGTLTLKDTTISGNHVTNPQVGGGIFNVSANTTITNCTITGNNAFQGGGIHNFGSTQGTVNLRNTIVAGNAASFGSADCQGPLNSLGHNLVQ